MTDKNPTFPNATAGAETISLVNTRPAAVYGEVWLQTLNEFQKSEAYREAAFYTATKMLIMKSGTVEYNSNEANFEEMSQTSRARFISADALNTGDIRYQAEQKFPTPIYPEKDDNNDNKYDLIVERYLAETEIAFNSQQAYIDEEIDKLVALWEVKSDLETVKKCMDIFKRSMRDQIYSSMLNAQMLWRAIRKVDSHLERYYDSIEIVLDLDDDLQQKLIMAYNSLDTVKSDEIPT